MKCSEFTGNKRIVDYFRTAIARGRLGHAYLLSGIAGLGKATLARIICKSLLCKNPNADGPCETCSSCHKFESGNHPDFHFSASDGLYFKIDQIRQIIHAAAFKPVESSWKAFLLEDVDHMRDEAANAFLKVLEEHPGQAIFFLICERAAVLLPTIRSRCLHFEFQPLQPQEIRNWLIHARQYSESDAANLSRFTHGSIGRALTLNAEEYRDARDKVLLALEAELLPRSYFTLIDAIRSISVDRAEMAERLLLLEEMVRDLMLLRESKHALLVHSDLASRFDSMIDKAPSLQSFYEDLLESREAMLKVNANISLSLQALFLPLRTAAQEKKIKSA